MKKLACWGLLLLLLAGAGLWLVKWTAPKKSTPPAPVKADRSLTRHSDLFKKDVVKVGRNVYVAIGYGLANSIMIVGHDGVIIVDTMTTNEEAAEVLAAFRRITDKPVEAIIYTHNHADHVFGAEVFAPGASPDIYAHASTEKRVMRIVTEITPKTPADLRPEDVSILVRADSKKWRELLAGFGNPLKIMAGFDYPKGNTIAFARFMALFEPGEMKLAYEPLSVLGD